MPESAAHALHQRYRTDVSAFAEGPWNDVIATQLAHRSVRKFTDEAVPDSVIRIAAAAAQSASTSSNIQAWSLVVVRDRAKLGRIADAIGDQGLVRNAPVLLVWVADLARNDALLQADDAEQVTADYLESTLVGFVDTALAAQNALVALESLGWGGVFVGALHNDPSVIAEELHLPERSVGAFGMVIGRPDAEEGAGVKPRLPQRSVVHSETYDADAWQTAADEYEAALAEYYAAQGRPDFSWRRTLRSRLGKITGLYGRHTMRDSLTARGFPSE